MRAKAAIENVTKDNQAIIVTEIPYQVNKARLIERIADLVNDKVMEDISDIRDESDRDGMRIVIELKRGTEPQIVLNQLYKHTQMQESFSMIFLAVVNGQPQGDGPGTGPPALYRPPRGRGAPAHLLPAEQGPRARTHPGGLPDRAGSPGQCDCHYPRQREPRRSPRKPGRLSSAAKRSKSTSAEKVQVSVGRDKPESPFTARQADAILELQLHRLTGSPSMKFVTELKEIREEIAEYESILARKRNCVR